jgi:hypothetical protein
LIGVFSNRLLLGCIAFELVFAAALIYLPPVRGVFGTAALDPVQVAFLLSFPAVVWGADELRSVAGPGPSVPPRRDLRHCPAGRRGETLKVRTNAGGSP